MMLAWLRRRREAARRATAAAEADADAIMRQHGVYAYWEVRQRKRDVVILPDGKADRDAARAHWGRVETIIAKRIGHEPGLDNATKRERDRR